MRRIGIIGLLATVLISCGSDYVHRQAIMHQSVSEIDMATEYFSICYYRLPKDFKELNEFIDESEWKELIEIRDRPLCAFYQDSVFLYFRRCRLGCCIYGHPVYWLQHPDEYPSDRIDYFENFRISGFDSNGRFVFSRDYELLSANIKTISINYKGVISCKNRIFTPWRDSLKIGPKLFLLEYSKEDDKVKLIAELKHEGGMYISDKHDISRMFLETNNISIGDDYIHSVKHLLAHFLDTHIEIHKLLVPLNIYCDIPDLDVL